jgi:DHA2 family multidrug resistance protein-like MFS transporter
MALLLALGPWLLPEFRDPEAGRPDLLSAALSLVAVLAVIYGLKQMAQDGLEWVSVVSILAGLVVGFVFLRRQGKLDDPLIDVRLFHAPAFSASLAVYTLGILVLFGTFFFIFQYLQLVLGLSPLVAGLWTLPSFGAFIVGSMVAPTFVRRVRPAFVMGPGLAAGTVGFLVLTQVEAHAGLPVLVTASIVYSLGLAPLFTLTNDLIIGSAPPEQAGAASGISETGAELGGALSIAILGTLGTAVYRMQVDDGIPAAVPPEEADAARDTIGGAVAAADDLPEPLAAQVLDAAREAFTQGLQAAALASAVVAAVTAVLTMILLRHVRAGSEPEPIPAQIGGASASAAAAEVER